MNMVSPEPQNLPIVTQTRCPSRKTGLSRSAQKSTVTAGGAVKAARVVEPLKSIWFASS